MNTLKTALYVVMARRPRLWTWVFFVIGLAMVIFGEHILTGTWVNYAWLYDDYLILAGLLLAGAVLVIWGVTLVFYSAFLLGLMKFFK